MTERHDARPLGVARADGGDLDGPRGVRQGVHHEHFVRVVRGEVDLDKHGERIEDAE